MDLEEADKNFLKMGVLGFLIFWLLTIFIVVPGYTLALGVLILEALARYREQINQGIKKRVISLWERL